MSAIISFLRAPTLTGENPAIVSTNANKEVKVETVTPWTQIPNSTKEYQFAYVEFQTYRNREKVILFVNDFFRGKINKDSYSFWTESPDSNEIVAMKVPDEIKFCSDKEIVLKIQAFYKKHSG